MMGDKSDRESGGFTSFLHYGNRTKVYEMRFGLWVIAWAVVYAGTEVTLTRDLVTTPYSWAIACVPVLFALLPLRAYYHFILRADELVRRMQMESIGIGFTVGLLYSFSQITFEELGLEAPEAGDVGVVMLFAWGLAQLYGLWKYR